MRVFSLGLMGLVCWMSMLSGCDDKDSVTQRCGNSLIEGTEQCDGTELGGATCSSLPGGFAGGTLACTDGCTFDTTGCTMEPPVCGDGLVDPGEDCDGDELGGATCQSVGEFTGGILGCTQQCTFDTSGCLHQPPACGNGVLDQGEDCDGEDLGGSICENVGDFAGGTLACNQLCELDTSGCVAAGDLVITEIMIHPGDALGSAAQWLEVYNASTAPIHLGGLRLGSNGDATHIIEPAAAPTIPQGGYVVLGSSSEPTENGGVTLDYQYSGILLENDADRIGLYGSSGAIIDEVLYDVSSGGWTVTEGASVQLDGDMSPSASGNDYPANWCDSRDSYGTAGLLGTPGQANVSCLGSADNLFFSEYVEGSSNNKALEIYNGGQTTVAMEDCWVRIYSNGSAIPSLVVQLSAGALSPGGIHVMCNIQADLSLASFCDQLHGYVNFNGNDAVELLCSGYTMDVIGRIGENPGTAWTGGSVSTLDQTLRRKCTVTTGNPDGSDAFDPSIQWDGFAIDTFDGLGQHCI